MYDDLMLYTKGRMETVSDSGDDNMKIGLVSYEFKNNNLDFNFNQIEKAIINSGNDVDILCFGETFLQGFDSLSWNFNTDRKIAVAQDSEIIQEIKKLSKSHNIDLAIGYIERDGESLYSSYAVIEKGKIIHNYRRITKNWKEYNYTDYHYCEGNQVKSFLYKGHEITIALCGDMWICPEKFKTEGLVIWPVYCNFSLAEWESAEQVEYAKQAKIASDNVLLVNSISRDPLSVGGALYFHNGKIMQKLPFGTEGILSVELPSLSTKSIKPQ